MYQYLYAIADRLPAAWRPPEDERRGPVVLRRLGDLAVVACAVDLAPVANARTLAVHHDVVASTLDAAATLPFRFGTVVATADLDTWLDAHAPLVRATLGPATGLRRDERQAPAPALRALDRRGAAAECADGASASSSSESWPSCSWRRRAWSGGRYRSPAAGGNVAGSVAFLVPRSEIDAFLTRIAPIASRGRGDRRRADRAVARVLVRSGIRPLPACQPREPGSAAGTPGMLTIALSAHGIVG